MSRKKQVNQKITALYCRISLDDGGDNESMSISNQKLMLKEFAEKNGMFQYATIQELDETVLNRLISRILVGEVKKVDGQKVQEVRIVYNFIGELR